MVAQRLKCLPAMRETWVRTLGREDPLEKEMATHSSILAWRIPWMEEPGGLQSTGSQRVGHDRATAIAIQREPTTWSKYDNPGFNFSHLCQGSDLSKFIYFSLIDINDIFGGIKDSLKITVWIKNSSFCMFELSEVFLLLTFAYINCYYLS